jgi:hypothetical protein
MKVTLLTQWLYKDGTQFKNNINNPQRPIKKLIRWTNSKRNSRNKERIESDNLDYTRCLGQRITVEMVRSMIWRRDRTKRKYAYISLLGNRSCFNS